jgi:ABC-type transport system substrate-binding protein
LQAQLSGVIVEPFNNSNVTRALRLCDDGAVCRFYGAIYPRLIGVDAITGQLTTDRPLALAQEWQVDGDVYTVRLREDLRWSDGQAITAYDVFYSFWIYFLESRNGPSDLQQFSQRVIGARPLDDHTIAFQFRQAGCDDLSRLTFLVLPVSNSDERQALITASTEFFENAPEDLGEAWDEWREQFTFREFPLVSNFVIDPALPYLADGPYYRADLPERAVIYPTDRSNPLAGYEIVYRDNRVDGFLQGDFNLISDPPFDRVQDLLTIPGVNLITAPSAQLDYLLINFTNPREPRSFDGEDDPDIQNEHPLFADPLVRQALRAAIEVDPLIEASLLGYGHPVSMLEAFGKWTYNTDLAPFAFDPRAAEALLDAANWKLLRGESVRSCMDCAYHQDGALLSFTLSYQNSSRNQITADMLTEMWERVGFRVQTNSFDDLHEIGSEQEFDVILATYSGGNPYRAFPYADLTEREDQVETGRNYGSYVNTDFDLRLASESACEQSEQAALYRDLTQMLIEDVAVIPLFSPDRVWIAAPGVMDRLP